MEVLALQILLLCHVVVGTVGNILLFVHNFSPILTDSRLRPIQVILINLAVANAIMLLLFAYSYDLTDIVPRKPPTDLKCKLEFFIRLVARSTNLCSTCVLSVHQFVTLVPVNRGKGKLVLRASVTNMASYSSYSCWFFSVLSNIHIPIKVTGPQITDNNTDSKSNLFCSTSGFIVGIVFLQFSHDATFMSIMVWTSVSMVLLLHRHRQRMQHILTPNQDPRGQAESRATRTILMLVVTFVSFYLLNCICIILHALFMHSHFFVRLVSEILTAIFPSISPLLLIFRDPKDPCSVLFKC